VYHKKYCSPVVTVLCRHSACEIMHRVGRYNREIVIIIIIIIIIIIMSFTVQNMNKIKPAYLCSSKMYI